MKFFSTISAVSRIPIPSLNQILKPANIDRMVLACKVLFILLGLSALAYFAMAVVDTNSVVSESIARFEQRKEILLAQAAKQNIIHRPVKKDYSDLAGNSVFGQIVTVSTATTTTTKKPQETKLPLVLIGVFMPEGDSPYSIIEDEKRHAQEVFMIGDSVFDVAKLTSISADSVEINRNGSKELLLLDNGTTKSGGDAPSADANEEQVTVDSKELDDALQNLPLLLTQARAVPYFRDGKAVGLRLFAIRAASLFEKIGLQNGDVLKTVNGNSMADMSQALQLFQKLKDERSVTVNLERNMAEKTIQYEIR